MKETKLKRRNYLLLSVGFIVTLGFVMYASSDSFLNIFTLWTLIPYLFLLAVSYSSKSKKTLTTVFVLSIAGILSIYYYFDVLFINFGAQGGLIFLFLPLYQLLAITVSFLALWIVNFFSNRK